MSIERPYYAILEVEQTAKPAEIRAAYRRLVKTRHPDVGGDPEAFILLNSAYTVLSNSELRSRYDLTGELDDFNPLVFQDSVIKSLAAAFAILLDQFVREGVPTSSRDFMETMRQMAEQGLEQMRIQKGKIESTLRELHSLHTRIKRKGEEKNLFAAIIEKQINDKSEVARLIAKDVRVSERCCEEIRQHKDVNELIRTMQAARYATSTTTPTGSTNWVNITFA